MIKSACTSDACVAAVCSAAAAAARCIGFCSAVALLGD